MIISPVTGRPTTPNVTKAPRPDDHRIGSQSNRLLARVDVAMDIEGIGIEAAHMALRAGAHVGAERGYASLEDAVRSLAFLTGNNTLSAAVVEDRGRFYGYKARWDNLNEQDNEIGSGRDVVFTPSDYGIWSTSMRAVDVDTKLRAVVDGSFVHRFHKS